MKPLLKLFALIFSLGVIAGCVAQPVKNEPSQQAQLIVKFKAYVRAPSDPVYLAKLSRDIDAPLTYVRAMAGSSHVLKLGYRTEADLNSALARLDRHADVEYAEIDRIMRITQ